MHRLGYERTNIWNQATPALIAKKISNINDKQTTFAAIFNPLDRDVFVEKWIRVGKVTGVTDGPKGIHDLDPEWAVLGDINPYGEEVPKSFTKQTEDLSEEEKFERQRWVRDQFRSFTSKQQKVTAKKGRLVP